MRGVITGLEEADTVVPSSSSAASTLGRGNMLAGIAGYGWTSVLQLVATPVLLHLLGAESFGLLGFYLAVQGASQILDLGLSPTINREMARASVERCGDEAHDFLRTIEGGYWAIGGVLGLLIALLAPALTAHWAGTSGLPASEIRRDVALIGLLIAIQWPVTLYEGGLNGLQRSAILHVVSIIVRSAGVAAGLAILYWGPRELWVYLLSLAAASLVHVLLLARLLRTSMPPATRASRWDIDTVYRVWRFAAGVSGMALLGAVLTHADRLLLSRMLPLGAFGYYVLAGMVSTGLYVFILPVYYTLFPVLAGRVVAVDERGERDVYHLGAQSFAVLVIPVATAIVLFAEPLLFAWTGSAETMRQAAPIVRLLVIGTALNGLTSAASALQLAHGWTRIGIVIHLGLIVVFVPSLVVATMMYGATGAAFTWLALNALYLAAIIPLTHRRLLRGEAMHWLTRDVLAPGAPGVIVAMLGWLAASRLTTHPVGLVISAVLTVGAGWLASALAADRVRQWLLPSEAIL